jgi:hypothetical protein
LQRIIAELYIIRIINMRVHKGLSARPLPTNIGILLCKGRGFGTQMHHNSAAIIDAMAKLPF